MRYWLNDHVQSRFYGSQFMGHATAQDLLQHFKVSMPYIYLLTNLLYVII